MIFVMAYVRDAARNHMRLIHVPAGALIVLKKKDSIRSQCEWQEIQCGYSAFKDW